MMTMYELRYPVTYHIGDEEHVWRVAEIRRPIAADYRMIDKETGTHGRSLAMIMAVTGQNRIVVDKLDGLDMTAIGDIISDFLEPGPPTGGTS